MNDPNEKQTSECSNFEIETELSFGRATFVLVGSQRKGNSKESSDYDFVVCPKSGSILYTQKLWGDISAEIMEKINWHEGIKETLDAARSSFNIPPTKDVDIFIPIKNAEGKISIAKLEWDDGHGALKGWMEGTYFDEIKPLIETYL